MSRIHMLVGMPGSGKSHYAKTLSKSRRAQIVSTDAVRQQLFGAESRQKNSYAVFNEAFRQIEQALSAGQEVIFDATNGDRSRRLQFLKRFHNVPVDGYIVDTPYDMSRDRIGQRKRRLDDRILTKYAKNMELPMKGEGFDQLHIVHTPQPVGLERSELERLLQQMPDHDELFHHLAGCAYFAQMIGFDQENPYHSRTLSRHTYAVLEYMNVFYEGEDLLAMQLAALFHDAGKPFCKVWKPARGYYSYYGHEHISASMTCHALKELGYDDEFVLDVAARVSLHMEILHGGDAGASKIYHLAGADMLSKLYFFAEGDTFGK
ncbi:AAA family ATPase [Paenibacillus sp. JX-17]|uniref:AAA family ATPase n=1 Tax=Paenibacillus lacisoli TaxID=3064525 RepID=A0ABT9CET4_9BACL|nr:AAA family ATPase [Paenibacillus sp. JX-17]MDO7907785.1 AAA family ATPase [Paenibacillus sp. JX-17]